MDLPANLDALREKYTALREAQRELNRKLMTMLPKQAIKESAQKLGFWKHGGVSVEHEDHFGVLADYAIYDYRLRGATNAVERLWRQQVAQRGTPKHLVLEAMRDARCTVVQVVEPAPGIGAVVDDQMYGGQQLLADLLLSENCQRGLTIGARVLGFPEFVMTTGASFAVDSELTERIVAILQDETEPRATRIRELVAKDKSWLTALIIMRSLAPDDDGDDEDDFG